MENWDEDSGDDKTPRLIPEEIKIEEA